MHTELENQLTSISWNHLLDASPTGYMVFHVTPPATPATGSLARFSAKCVFANPAAGSITGLGSLTGLSFERVFGHEPDQDISVGFKDFENRFEESGLLCKIGCSALSDGNFLFAVTRMEKLPESSLLAKYSRQLWLEAEQTMQFGSWIWNVTRTSFEWTEGMYRLMGYDPGDIGTIEPDLDLWMSHIRDSDRETVTRQLAAIPAFSDSFVLEFMIVDKVGIEKYLYLKGQNVQDETTGDTIFLGTVFDISVLKQMQSDLESKVTDLNKSNADLEQFAYVASHDLQEPLRKIASFGERLGLKANDSLDDEQRVYLDRILNATKRMQTMVSNLLEFSKIAVSESIFIPTDLNEVLVNTLNDLELVIQIKQAGINVDRLPVIDAVPSQMAQLFINLISNSLKFTKSGVSPEIYITCEEPEIRELEINKLSLTKAYVKLIFTDNGIGFANKNAERIFTIFQRLRGRSEFEGAGIGLSVCKKVVEMHHGAISAFGIPDGGARFEIILPRSQNV